MKLINADDVLREFDEALDAARLLGATDAKRGFGCYTETDSRVEVALWQSIAKHRNAIATLPAAQPEQCAASPADALHESRWKAEAQRYAANADYWRERAEKADARPHPDEHGHWDVADIRRVLHERDEARELLREAEEPPIRTIRTTHEAVDAFWRYWRENGEAHKHGYYESTWGAINAALRVAGTVPHVAEAKQLAADARLEEAQQTIAALKAGCEQWQIGAQEAQRKADEARVVFAEIAASSDKMGALGKDLRERIRAWLDAP